MKISLRIAIICLIILILSCSNVSVFATEYHENVIAEDFSSNSTDFLIPGDMDSNGVFNASDLSFLRKQLLEDEEKSIYSDVNGDGYIDARDIVRQKKNLVEIISFVHDGKMILNGKTVYNGDVLSKLGSGASYQISCSYTSETPITIKVSGLKEEIVCVGEVAENTTTYTHSFKTPLNLADISDVSVCIIGTGNIEDFEITRVNMDNELVENW